MENCITHNRSRPYWQLFRSGNRQYAHRIICAMTHNMPLSGDWETRHLCGNARCLNPEHLMPGTRQENCDDIKRHGTQNKGERNGMSKLTETEAALIKYMDGSHAAISREMNVSRTLVTLIKQGKRWAHV